MKTDCLTCGNRRMGENGECGPCAKARLDRVFGNIREKRERGEPEPSGQSGITDFL